jgi:hypothetical protein
MLLDATVKTAVWDAMQIPQTVRFPVLGEELLYGVVAEDIYSIHGPLVRSVYVSDDESEDVVEFFKYLLDTMFAKEYLTLDSFSEADAWAGLLPRILIQPFR